MRETTLPVTTPAGEQKNFPMTLVHTLVLGSGAAGLATAVQLRAQGVDDVLMVSEGLGKGTSINTGSDKQTYYKLSMCGTEPDSPGAMAETYFAGGSMHGDLALAEAAGSARAFLHLVNLGVPFPRDAYGQFVGYKTDHDPRQRATSIGPYTSRDMCRALIGRVRELAIPVWEDRVAVRLLTTGSDRGARVAGAILARENGSLEAIGAENVVFATGGPGGLYKASVYPKVHTGGIGLALLAGAQAQSLPESQYGLASIRFRWNVSGTFMQVVPRFISTAADGKSDPREFMVDYFDTPGQMHSRVFLKGYQWPFDSRKVVGGSSLVDILVYIETELKGRRVFLDFRSDPADFRFDALDDEAREYLTNSKALQKTPIERLRQMNPGAIALYADHHIDLAREPLEVAVCAQHNNGGLAANHWWESVNLAHLFPVGEVNGSHGVYRPGGSALNAGQVGAFRAAEFIARRYARWSLSEQEVHDAAIAAIEEIQAWLAQGRPTAGDWRSERAEWQERMSRVGAAIRGDAELREAVEQAWLQYERIERDGRAPTGDRPPSGPSENGTVSSDAAPNDLVEALRNRSLCFAHAVYLEAILFWLESGVGSRGSALVVDPAGEPIHPRLDDTWRALPEDDTFRDLVQETLPVAPRHIEHRWVSRRPLPKPDHWFETAWAKFRSGEIYDGPGQE